MSKSNLDLVKDFHERANQPVNLSPTVPDSKAIYFRQQFLLEETLEGFAALLGKDSTAYQLIEEHFQRVLAIFKKAAVNDKLNYDPVEFLDSLADIQYVILGTSLYYGFPLQEAFEEVHKTNLSRFPRNQLQLEATLMKAENEGVAVTYHRLPNEEGFAVIRSDNGKLYKNAHYTPPDLAPLATPTHSG